MTAFGTSRPSLGVGNGAAPLPSPFRGNSPCKDCGTTDNIVWFTESVFWNQVVPEVSPILCLPCFIVRAERKFKVDGWRVLPSWPWTPADLTDTEGRLL